MSGIVDHPLNQRERELVDVLVHMHAEFGLTAEFTSAAVGQIAGPCAGSLAGLTMHGYVKQRVNKSEVVYQLAEKGFALFAGVEID